MSECSKCSKCGKTVSISVEGRISSNGGPLELIGMADRPFSSISEVIMSSSHQGLLFSKSIVCRRLESTLRRFKFVPALGLRA